MIPYATDAPVYHFPKATIGLIGLNAVMFLATWYPGTWTFLSGYPLLENISFSSLCLEAGELNPLQWVTSLFMHADLLHLLVNMTCLWAFGLIVEGKVGWWRMLLIYLGIGILDSQIWQLILYPMHGYSDSKALGASGAIFGLMGVSLIWAPENDMEAVTIIWLHPFFFTLQVKTLTAIMIGVELFVLWISAFALSGTVAHLIGFTSGLAIGTAMLKSGLVDCEGYDLFTCWRGEAGKRPVPTRQEEYVDRETQAALETWQHSEIDKCVRSISFLLEKGSADAVIGRFQALKRMVPHATWKQEHLYQLIGLLIKEQRYADAIEWGHFHLRSFKEMSESLKLTISHIYLSKLGRPSKAFQLAKEIDVSQLHAKARHTRATILCNARRELQAGALDFQD